MTENKKEVKRVPVDFRYDALNPDFLKMLAKIGHYAAEKYGSWEQYLQARLEGEKSCVNHIYEHLRQLRMEEPHDKFGGVEWHLVAIAYNAMMEWEYRRRFGAPLPNHWRVQPHWVRDVEVPVTPNPEIFTPYPPFPPGK